MPTKIDPKILAALSLGATTTKISAHGGSGFASTFKLTAKKDNDTEKLYFVKIAQGEGAKIMFEGASNR